jgi:pimeloyl-ACP methyl ester carboxylesterase
VAEPAGVGGNDADPNLDGLFSVRVRQGVGGAVGQVRGSVAFHAPPAGSWTLRLDDGAVGLDRGAPPNADCTVRTDPHTLTEVLNGELSGVQAFLDGRLIVRGNLALALLVDGAFDVGERPASFPSARFVDAAGVRTAYLDAGPRDAPPVLLLHGLGATNASMLPLLPELARDHRVVAPDLPGFGASAAPWWAYTFDDLARWLFAFQEATATTGAVLVGNSLGGRVAIEAALLMPADVPGLVLLCPSPAFRRIRQFVPLVRMLHHDLSVVPMVFAHRFVVRVVRWMFSRPERLPAEWYDAAADEFQRVMRSVAHRRAFFACLRQIYLEEAHGERGFWDRLGSLHTPSLFIWGERDRLVPAGFERHVVAAVPGAHSVMLRDCGHVPQYEFADQTRALVRRFLRSL